MYFITKTNEFTRHIDFYQRHRLVKEQLRLFDQRLKAFMPKYAMQDEIGIDKAIWA